MKKLLTGITAAALTFGAIAPSMSVFAAEKGEKNVPVTYDNRNIIPDPDNPNDAAWGVVVPTAIAFTDTKTEVAANVELVGMNGHVISELGDKFSVNVKVKSANGMKLVYDTDSLGYTLAYGDVDVIGTTDVPVADLTVAAPEKVGKATFNGDKAKKLGNHTDTLTYTIQDNDQ